MKMEMLDDNRNTMKFVLKEATNAYANAVRRAATGSVPTFAIDAVTFYENSSAMFDEYIAHRIGLVPITTPSRGYSEKDEVVFTLEAEGPKTVYSKELKSADKEVKAANDAIPLIKLAEGQRIRLDGKARMGVGSTHAKFQPGLVTYEQKGDDTFEFYVESFGQMPPKQIINKALDAIEEQADSLLAKAKKL
ncbi:MAG: DNA-directed RNA polymerase subunit D [Candidatus Marsarchaeota archaeon]|jgi:DNA-directed RNA polymerase subunit D|nr:DNA-directed RNA polymerase subunit D [Candidatus Marsarchaeota archaeon]MCL5115016.1 DNA-directed RNA polymerase subunit D [Candidatus Marsarchaeota archaeon]